VISYSQVSVTDQEADPSMKYFNVTCPTDVGETAIVEQTWSSTGSDYVEGYGCQCSMTGTVQDEVIVDALISARGSVKCLPSLLMNGEPKLHMPTSILITAPEITPGTTGTYFKVTCPPVEPSAYDQATYPGTVERMATGSSLAYLPADGCTCRYKSGAVVTQVHIDTPGQHNVMCMPGTGNGDWATLRHDPKVLIETLKTLDLADEQKFLEFDCAGGTMTPLAAPANPESYSEGMGCKCMDASGYVSSQIAVTPSESAALGKFQVSCVSVSTGHAQVLEYPRGAAKNPAFADEYLDVYCSDGDKVDVVGTSTIPGAKFYSD
jgi:hypothetical protein